TGDALLRPARDRLPGTLADAKVGRGDHRPEPGLWRGAARVRLALATLEQQVLERNPHVLEAQPPGRRRPDAEGIERRLAGNAWQSEVNEEGLDHRFVPRRSSWVVPGQRGAHEREAQGGQPGRPGLLAAQDGDVTLDTRRGLGQRAARRAAAAFLRGR